MNNLLEKYKSIKLNINDAHHPKSIELMEHIEFLDINFTDDYFCWKTGGDGDNGEVLMYLLDMFFKMKDEEEQNGM